MKFCFSLAVGTMAVLVVLSGCSLVPPYERPSMPGHLSGYQENLGKESEESAGLAYLPMGWKQFFTDPVLQNLIDTAFSNNRDLKTAALRVQEFQARYRIERSRLFPSLGTRTDYVRQLPVADHDVPITEMFSASIGISGYELDFFSRMRNLKDAALETYLAMESSYKSTGIVLIAQVAEAYFRFRADQELVRISKETVSMEQEFFDLMNQRVQAGITNELELVQARSSLEHARLSLAMYESMVIQDRNALGYLVGNLLPDMEEGCNDGVWSKRYSLVLPDTLPSEILLLRPDIIAAEHELKAAHARIGAARAAFFPSISLTGNAGFMSRSFSDLFDTSSKTWLFSPAIHLPIFTGGRLKGQLDAAKIRKEICVAAYERVIERAFREAADALAAGEGYDRQLTSQRALLAASSRYYELAKKRYDEGVDSFLTLLDAQRLLFQTRCAMVSLELAKLLNQVGLYKALGGGLREQMPK